MSTPPLTPTTVTFADLRIGDEIRAFPTAEIGVEFAGRVEDRSTHTLWIGRTHGPRRIVHDIDGHRFELVHPAPPAPWTQPTVACPSWCGQDAIDDEGGVIHVRKIGTMGVEISECYGCPAGISWPEDDPMRSVGADEARQIGADPVEAARLLGGVKATQTGKLIGSPFAE